MSRQWVVYLHENRINGKKYIGVTSQKPERRWQNGAGYVGNARFYNAIKKYGWDAFRHEILYTGMSQEDAERLEIELIAKYHTQDPQKGYNLREGGKFSAHSAETKAKISAAHVGKSHGPLKPETKQKQSKALKGRFTGDKNPMYGKPGPRRGVTLSSETKARISAAMKGKQTGDKNPMYGKEPATKGKGQAVQCIETGETFGSIGEAARHFGLNTGGVWRSCRCPTRTAGGHHWQFIVTTQPSG